MIALSSLLARLALRRARVYHPAVKHALQKELQESRTFAIEVIVGMLGIVEETQNDRIGYKVWIRKNSIPDFVYDFVIQPINLFFWEPATTLFQGIREAIKNTIEELSFAIPAMRQSKQNKTYEVFRDVTIDRFQHFKPRPIRQRIDHLLTAEKGWLDGTNGEPINPEKAALVCSILEQSFKETMPLIFPTPEGGIMVEDSWPSNELSLNLEFDFDSMTANLLVADTGPDGEILIDEEFPFATTEEQDDILDALKNWGVE